MLGICGLRSLAAFGGRILPYEMDEPPAALLRLTRFLLGGEPSSRDASRKQYWFSLIGGVAFAVLFACLWLLPPGPAGTRPFSEPAELTLGLIFAAQGAAGLLKEDRRALSLWLSVLGALLAITFVFLMGAVLYAWMGILGVGVWGVVLVLVGILVEARRRRRA